MKRWMWIAVSGGLLIGSLGGGIALAAGESGSAMHHKHGPAMHHGSSMHEQGAAMHDAGMENASLTG
jgi:hypothetical protein